MKTFITLTCVLFSFISALHAQSTSKYWVQLSDKNNSPYNISNPSAFLSSRAISRRAIQGIAIDAADIPVNTSYITQIQNAGATVLVTSRWLNAVVIQTTSSTVLNDVNALPFVLGTQPVAFYKRANNITEDNISPLNGSQEKMHSTNDVYSYGNSQNQIAMLNGICMHNQGYDGKNMVISILDAGFFHANTLDVFDSLWANNQILGTRDFVSGDTLVFDNDTHGSSVLSCIGGNVPGQLIGTAPKAKFWLLRTEEGATELIIEEDNWVHGAEFADSVGADVINSSLGYSTFDIPSQDHTYADLNGKTSNASIAATMAARKGMIVCNSAGNEGSSPWHYISIPADADSILTVGAVDATQAIAGFSSVGPTSDGRIKPNVVAQGVASVLVNANSNMIGTGSGTSFSSPITAGMVACLWQANPTKKNVEIMNAIQQSASQYFNPDNSYGYGIPNYCKADSILKGFFSIKQYESDDVIMLSPNPFSSTLSFVLFPSLSENLIYEIYDVQGKLLLGENRFIKQKSQNTINIVGLESLAKGMYIFVAKSDNFVIAKKIIKE